MIDPPYFSTEPFGTDNFYRMLDDAVRNILSHEDFRLFKDWLVAHIGDYGTPGDGFPQDPDGQRELAMQLVRPIWNTCPLRRNRLTPDPVGQSKRNEPCFCGSGKKNKKCCGQVRNEKILPQEDVWITAAKHIGLEPMVDMVRAGEAEPEALLLTAKSLVLFEQPDNALALLEYFFNPEAVSTDNTGADILRLLCQLYKDHDEKDRQLELLEYWAGTGEQTPMRSQAYAMLATNSMERRDYMQAWVQFEQALKDNPENLELSMLELELLLREGRYERAKQRAMHWLAKVKSCKPSYTQLINILQQIAKDPEKVHNQVGGGETSVVNVLPDLKPLEAAVKARPLSRYTVKAVDPDTANVLETGYGGATSLPAVKTGRSSSASQSLEKALQKMQAEARAKLKNQGGCNVLVPPDHLADVEREWRKVFPMDKPFGMSLDVFDIGDSWTLEGAARWSEFLLQRPEAFDSLDILDDISNALSSHPKENPGWRGEPLHIAVLQRARSIIMQAVEPGTTLSWQLHSNQPALRMLSLLTFIFRDQESLEEIAAIEDYLAVNPVDEHNNRGALLNHYLQQDRNQEALALVEKYPDSTELTEFLFGAPLLLYRLGRKDEAAEALRSANKIQPYGATFLVRNHVAKPHVSEFSLSLESSAWTYREQMRGEWLRTDGALEWLQSVT